MKFLTGLLLLLSGQVICSIARGGAITVEEKDCRFFSGEKIERTVKVAADTLAWKTSVLGAPVQKEKTDIEQGRAVVELTMPDVKRRATLDWSLTAARDGADAGSTTVSYSVFPKHKDSAAGREQLAVFDPAGATAEIFEGGNVKTLKTRMQLATFRGECIVIAPGALDAVRWDVLSSLEEKIQEGANVLILAQDTLPDELLFETTRKPDIIGAERLADGKLFEEIHPGDLSLWRGDGTIAESILSLSKPVNMTRLLCEAEGTGVLAAETYHGAGVIVFSQVAICRKYFSEPVAHMALRNLIRHVRAIRPPVWRAVRLSCDPSGNFALLLKKLKINIADAEPLTAEGLTDVKGFLQLKQPPLLVFAWDKEYLKDEGKHLRSAARDIRHFLSAGGTMAVFCASQDFINTADEVFRRTVALKEPDGDITVNMKEPLGKGLIPEEFEALVTDAPAPIAIRAEGTRLTEVVAPGLISYMEVEKGKVVFVQIPIPDLQGDEDLDVTGYLPVLSQVFTNLGIRIESVEE